MKITAPHSVIVGGALYMKVVNSSFIISKIPLVSPFSSFSIANTCLNNVTVLLVQLYANKFRLAIEKNVENATAGDKVSTLTVF